MKNTFACKSKERRLLLLLLSATELTLFLKTGLKPVSELV